jgi:FkbM family methyltransferase
MKKLYRLKFFFILTLLLSLRTFSVATDDVIIVNKQNVTHRFVRFDEQTDRFVSQVFLGWENETFEVFDRFKNNQGIAIDIGAWIGTTSIWLANNFHHVVAIEADQASLFCLERNLQASGCSNVSICKKPISDTTEQVVFGPRGTPNDSTSYIKKQSDNIADYLVKTSTFKQMLYDYVYSNTDLSSHKITFIKCNIAGGEENILEDVLHFAYNNECPVYMSFHTGAWSNKKINDFEYLFKYFDTNCPVENVREYITNHPSASLIFIPKKNAGLLIKKNLTAAIIGYNQPTYIKNMVKQLEKYTSDIVIIDNNSDSQSLLNYYNTDFKYTLLRMTRNHGYGVYLLGCLRQLFGDIYCLTDPDLQFNPNLPDSFLHDLIGISNHFQAKQVGFALLIDADDIRTDITYAGHSIKQWESQFWENKLYYRPKPKTEMYLAPIDTTFALINHRFNRLQIRVAGNYTCMHIPWHTNFRNNFEEGEYENFLKNNTSSTWFKSNN